MIARDDQIGPGQARREIAPGNPRRNHRQPAVYVVWTVSAMTDHSRPADSMGVARKGHVQIGVRPARQRTAEQGCARVMAERCDRREQGGQGRCAIGQGGGGPDAAHSSEGRFQIRRAKATAGDTVGSAGGGAEPGRQCGRELDAVHGRTVASATLRERSPYTGCGVGGRRPGGVWMTSGRSRIIGGRRHCAQMTTCAGSAEALIHEAPAPALARLERAHHRVTGLLVVLGGVQSDRGVAAPDPPAGEAQP